MLRSPLRLLRSMQRMPGDVFLLNGVTGSGKTLVYIEVLKRLVNEQGKTGIVLVPEIALTPQTVDRFRAVFGDSIAVLHSALSDGERYDAWLALRRGDKRIAVGARSAVFAPLANLGAIIVDEEHEIELQAGRKSAISRARSGDRSRAARGSSRSSRERNSIARKLGKRRSREVHAAQSSGTCWRWPIANDRGHRSAPSRLERSSRAKVRHRPRMRM